MNRVEVELSATGFGHVTVDGVEQEVQAVTMSAQAGELTTATLRYPAMHGVRYSGPAAVHYHMPDLVDEVVRLMTSDYRDGADFTTIGTHVERAIDHAIARVFTLNRVMPREDGP